MFDGLITKEQKEYQSSQKRAIPTAEIENMRRMLYLFGDEEGEDARLSRTPKPDFTLVLGVGRAKIVELACIMRVPTIENDSRDCKLAWKNAHILFFGAKFRCESFLTVRCRHHDPDLCLFIIITSFIAYRYQGW